MLVVLGKSLHATDFQCLRICMGFSGDIAKPRSDRWNGLWRTCKRSNDNSAQCSENVNFQEWFSGRTLKVSKGHGERMRRGGGARERSKGNGGRRGGEQSEGQGNGGRRGGGARDMENRGGDVGSRVGVGRMVGGEVGSRGRHRWAEAIQGDWMTNHDHCKTVTLNLAWRVYWVGQQRSQCEEGVWSEHRVRTYKNLRSCWESEGRCR